MGIKRDPSLIKVIGNRNACPIWIGIKEIVCGGEKNTINGNYRVPWKTRLTLTRAQWINFQGSTRQRKLILLYAMDKSYRQVITTYAKPRNFLKFSSSWMQVSWIQVWGFSFETKEGFKRFVNYLRIVRQIIILLSLLVSWKLTVNTVLHAEKRFVSQPLETILTWNFQCNDYKNHTRICNSTIT